MATTFLGKRRLSRRRIAVMLAGVLSVALAGSGLVAQVSDTVQVRDNQIASEPYEAPAPFLALEVAQLVDGESCANAAYEADGIVDGGLAGLIDFTTYIETGSDSQIVPLERICLRNAGTEIGRAFATLLARASTEIGACNATEFAAEELAYGGTTSCNDGDVGELDRAGSISAFPVFGQACYQKQALFTPVDAVGTELSMAGGGNMLLLAPGETCEVELRFILTNEQAAFVPAATSDRLTFDLAFTLYPAPLA